MPSLHNHRVFLASAGITVASVVSQPLIARPDMPKDPPVEGVRETVAGMDADHPVLASHWKAIEVMKKLPATDLRSWQFQAR